MVTVGISLHEINIIVYEGEVIMKESMMSVRYMYNIVEEISKLSKLKSELKSDLPSAVQHQDIIAWPTGVQLVFFFFSWYQ